MPRTFLLTLLAAGLVVAAGPPAGAQDKKKEKPKGPPRIAVNDPAKLTDDKDFAIQGEYLGKGGASKKDEISVGAHVIALGGGKFEVKWYYGGLPGAGWNGKPAESFKGERQGDRATLSITTPEGKTGDVGVIEDGKLTLALVAELKKTERKSPTLGAKPPAGAVVLYAGPGDEANWANGKLSELSDGKYLSVERIAGKGGDLKSKQAFGAFKAHVEFRLPWMPNSRGQGRGNSGVYVQDRYEIQVLDSFGLKGENNECGGVYTQHKPLVNMCLPPMAWQTYDIDFTPAAFEDGKKTKNARLTVRHNGVTIHDNVELPKECPGGAKEAATPGPFRLQDHGDPVVYRNFWVVETK
jgi:hypothetical protein